MKRIILFLIAFNFLNSAHGQWKRPYSPNHTYHHIYGGVSVGGSEILGTACYNYIFKYDDYFIQPYTGAHLGIMPFFGLGINTAGYAGINFKYLSFEAGVGNHFITAAYQTANIKYTFWRAGIQTKYGIIKAGPSWSRQGDFLEITTINNQEWTFTLLFDIKELDKL